MGSSDSSIEKTDLMRPEVGVHTEEHLTLRRYSEPPATEVTSQSRPYNFRQYWYILWSHKLIVLGFAATGLIVAILVSMVQTPVYRARTSLEIQDFNQDFMDLKNVDPTTSSGDDDLAESYFKTQILILQSDSLLARVVDKLPPREVRPAAGWRVFVTGVARRLGFSRGAPIPEKEQLIRQTASNLTVRTSGNTRLLEVVYDSPDPKLAADFTNTLVSEFIEQNQEMRWKATQRTSEWLTGHLDEMKTKLEAAEAELQDYAQTYGLTFTSEKDNIAETRIKELDDELSAARADRIAKQAKFEEAQNNSDQSVPDFLNDPTLQAFTVELTNLQRQSAQLSATLTPSHPSVKEVQAQIAELQTAVQKQRGAILSHVSDEYHAARRREGLLATAYAEQKKAVENQANNAIHYDTLKREVDSNRQLYESMLQKVKQAQLASAMAASNVLVVDPATPPTLPYKPNLPFNLAMGLSGGAFLGVLFAVVRNRVDPRIQSPGDARFYLNLPELGAIPSTRAAPRHVNELMMGLAPTTSSRLGGELIAGKPLQLATQEQRQSLLASAECFRATLSSILLPGQNQERPQVVVLTSPEPGDGKTTVACNLSIAMAEIGQKVLLIDGDLRKPSLHVIFDVANARGLSDVLQENTPLEGFSAGPFVLATKISGLYLLPAGRRTAASPPSLFHSPRMSRLSGRLRLEFDMIVIDTPPLIHLADARVLGRLSDGVILVTRAGKTTLEAALLASQRFAEDGTKLLGTVLNDWNPKSGAGYGGNYFDYDGQKD